MWRYPRACPAESVRAACNAHCRPMSSTRDLVTTLKAELKTAGVTYADLARSLDMSESSIKRMFSQADMPLSRIDEVLRVLGMDFTELAARVVASVPLLSELSEAQEAAIVAERKLLLMALCCISQWSYEQIVRTYRISEAEAVQRMAQLDRIGFIELKPLNRYRLLLAKTFRWRPGGPMMKYFRSKAERDYFSGDFDGDGEMLLLVHGQIGRSLAQAFNERLVRVAQDFAQQHLIDQKLPSDQKRPYTVLIGMRSWIFEELRDLRRDGSDPHIARMPGRPADANARAAGAFIASAPVVKDRSE